MGNGIMGKAIAGAGQGIAAVGQMSLHAQQQSDLEKIKGEVQAQYAKLIQGYEDRRSQAQIASQEKIHAANNQTQRDVAQTQADSHLTGIDKQVNARGDDLAAKNELDLHKLDYEYKLKKDLS